MAGTSHPQFRLRRDCVGADDLEIDLGGGDGDAEDGNVVASNDAFGLAVLVMPPAVAESPDGVADDYGGAESEGWDLRSRR
jgi:hypothetical protein